MLSRPVAGLGLGLGLLASARAQLAGKVVEEKHPSVTWQNCDASGCVDKTGSVTIDANWRWTHNGDGYTNCFTDGEWSPDLCPDGDSCSQTCALEGIDSAGYESTYGIKEVTGGLEMQYVSPKGNVGSRVYLMKDTEHYEMFKLKNREFSVDVDVKSLTCGMNGALYFVAMDADGGKGLNNNEAGAKFGTGYCDAQCPHDIKWFGGTANVDGAMGSCCTELDIWEANREATAFTTHPCSVQGPYACTGVDCGDGAAGERYMGKCDKDGCDFNSYRMGDETFFSKGSAFVDSEKPVQVVTQFITSDGTDNGDLIQVRRIYVQNGHVIQNSNSTIPGIQGNSLTESFCQAQKRVFADPDDHTAKGGLKAMGDAMDRGLVLTLSIWDDGATEMRWLDSNFPTTEDPTSRYGVARGPCSSSDSSPLNLRSKYPGASVSYTNIKVGTIGSTFSATRRLDVHV